MFLPISLTNLHFLTMTVVNVEIGSISDCLPALFQELWVQRVLEVFQVIQVFLVRRVVMVLQGHKAFQDSKVRTKTQTYSHSLGFLPQSEVQSGCQLSSFPCIRSSWATGPSWTGWTERSKGLHGEQRSQYTRTSRFQRASRKQGSSRSSRSLWSIPTWTTWTQWSSRT